MTKPHISQIITDKSYRSISPKKLINHPILRALTWILVAILLSSQDPPVFAAEKALISPVSLAMNGEFGESASTAVSISGDGRFIFFTSQADNLPHSDGTPQLYKYDRNTQELEALISSVTSAKVSSNGRTVAYTKNEPSGDAYLYDLLTSNFYPLNNPNLTNHLVFPITINALSGEGRYLIVTSPAALPNSTILTFKSPLLWMIDRNTSHTKRIFTPSIDCQFCIEPKSITLSDDGRIVAFIEKSKLGESDPDRIVLYNRVLDQRNYLQPPESMNALNQQISNVNLSGSGRIVAFMLSGENRNAAGNRLIVYDGASDKFQEILIFPPLKDFDSSSISLSDDGSYLAVIHTAEQNIRILSRINTETGEESIIDQGEIYGPLDIASDGNTVLYNKLVDGISQVFIWAQFSEWDPPYVVAGRVTDSIGTPLALVNIENQYGDKSRTDSEGFFWMSGLDAGAISITPSKKGFIFEPEIFNGKIASDLISTHFTSSHNGVLVEGSKDIGMPYSKNRGNQGPFHGFSAGYCTDLILDSFSWGVDFNISLALEMDYKANPDHFYRWRNARDAHDMWRYFSYSGQMHLHQESYQPGDIVFFDWSRDGEIDHVALVSQVDYLNRPKMMYDATGVITSNPDGLAAELPWEPFHENTVRGFARWSGLYEPLLQDLPKGNSFQVAFGGSGLDIRLLDSAGNAISGLENEIQWGNIHNLIWEQSISIVDIGEDNEYYLILARNPGQTGQPFTFTAQIIQDGLVTQRVENKGILESGEISRFPIKIEIEENGSLMLQLSNNNRCITGYLRIH